MADISKITLPNGPTYDLKDNSFLFGEILYDSTNKYFYCTISQPDALAAIREGRLVIVYRIESIKVTFYYASQTGSSTIEFTPLSPINSAAGNQYYYYYSSGTRLYNSQGSPHVEASSVYLKSNRGAANAVTLQNFYKAMASGLNYTISADGWSSEVTIVNDIDYYTYTLQLTPYSEMTEPIISIAPISGILPTEAEQDAYNTWEYAVCEKDSVYSRFNLTLYSRIVPTSDFAIHVIGAWSY